MDLRGVREQKGLTQQQLADLVGRDRSLIAKIENGCRPGIDTAKEIARVLNFDWTMFFEDEQAATSEDQTGTEG